MIKELLLLLLLLPIPLSSSEEAELTQSDERASKRRRQ